jgi:uncharacterized membrane protein YdjX (TVP38/TMEM64 family)
MLTCFCIPLFLSFFLFALLSILGCDDPFHPGKFADSRRGIVFSAAFGLGSGVALGAAAVFVGASLGALASFLLARYVLREQVSKLSAKYAIFQALDQALKENGLKIFVLLRLSPIIPFNIINYIGGVSSVSFRDYTIALLAILPGTVLYVFLGASAGTLTDSAMSGSDPTLTIVIVVVGAMFGILAVYLTTKYARRELNRVLTERQMQENDLELDERCFINDDENESAAPVEGASTNVAAPVQVDSST